MHHLCLPARRWPWQRACRWAAVPCVVAALWATPSYALFEDGEARRAILELRQRVDAQQQASQQQAEDTAQLRRSLLDLQGQIETLRAELATLHGSNEQLQQDVAQLQRHQRDMAQGVDQRLRQFEPSQIMVDGQTFQADPNEVRDFEAALEVFRSGRFAEAATAFSHFVRQRPQSGYIPSARFWLGNAQYATRNYKEAMGNFKALLAAAPDHERAPEAALSIANCQVELRDTRAARKTLEDLMRVYPQSEAALAARERLARLK